MTKVWFFDIDGTVADLGHRLHFINSKPKSWNRFFDACKDDSPIMPVIEMAQLIAKDNRIVFLSGRPERCRKDTSEWLEKYGFSTPELYMRPDGNTEPDVKIKGEIMDKLMASGMEAHAIVEDRMCMVKMWRERGYFVFDVNQSGKDY